MSTTTYIAIPSGGGAGVGPYRATSEHPAYPEWCARFAPIRELARRVVNGEATYQEAAPLRALVVWGKMRGVPAADNWYAAMCRAGHG